MQEQRHHNQFDLCSCPESTRTGEFAESPCRSILVRCSKLIPGLFFDLAQLVESVSVKCVGIGVSLGISAHGIDGHGDKGLLGNGDVVRQSHRLCDLSIEKH